MKLERGKEGKKEGRKKEGRKGGDSTPQSKLNSKKDTHWGGGGCDSVFVFHR